MSPLQHPTMGWPFGVAWVGLSVATHLGMASLIGFPYVPIGNGPSWDVQSGLWGAVGGLCWGGVVGLVQARLLQRHGVRPLAAHRWWAATTFAFGLVGTFGGGVPEHLDIRAVIFALALIVGAAYALAMKPVVRKPLPWLAALAGAWLGGIALGAVPAALAGMRYSADRFRAGAAVGLLIGMVSWWLLAKLVRDG